MAVGRPGRTSLGAGIRILWGSTNQFMARVYAATPRGSAPRPGGPQAEPRTTPPTIRPMTPERSLCLGELAGLILRVERGHPVRVAIDGPDAAGKTILADELAPQIERSGRPVIRASIDGFHRPRAERLARGPESPEGYLHDSFDYPALRADLLDPLCLLYTSPSPRDCS